MVQGDFRTGRAEIDESLRLGLRRSERGRGLEIEDEDEGRARVTGKWDIDESFRLSERRGLIRICGKLCRLDFRFRRCQDDGQPADVSSAGFPNPHLLGVCWLLTSERFVSQDELNPAGSTKVYWLRLRTK